MMRRGMRHILATCALLAGAPGPSAADVAYLPMTADRCTIAWALTGRAIDGCRVPPRPVGTYRSLGGEQGYSVHFPFDSNDLTGDAQAHLERLAGLLNGPLAGLCVKLVGHTDAVGAAGYNLALSEERAHSVRLFLAGPGLVPPARLREEGAGEAQLLPGVPGDDPRNRRVEVLAKPAEMMGACG